MWSLKLNRKRYQRRIADTPLAYCWQKDWPAGNCDWQEAEFLAVDTETSALDPATGEMLSIGWVLVNRGQVQLGSAEHYLLNSSQSVGQSAVIHQLRDCELADGIDQRTMMVHFLTAARGRILLFHHAYLDMAFLNQISRQLYRAPLLLPFADTMQLERRKMDRRGKSPGQESLRLADCRRRYRLPDYPAHNALVDALSTAELFIAQARHRSGGDKLGIKELM